jgi:membrane protease YdiL (CAAX protease family)
VIVSLVAFIMYRNDRASRTGSDDSTGIEDIRLRVMAEELIGIKSVASLAGPAQPKNLIENQKRLVSQMDESARTDVDRLHAAIIAGEILDKHEAIRRLDSIHSQKTSDLANDIESLRTIYSKGAAALDSQSQHRLILRHDYFGRVALAQGVPANVEPRKSVEAAGVRATLMLGLMGLIFLLLILGGVCFFIAAVVLRAKGRIGRAYVPDPAARTVYLEAFAIYFILFIIGFGLLRRYFGLMSLQWEWLALIIIPIVMLWLGWNGVSSEDQRNALGWHKGKGVLREAGAGIAGYFAGIVVMIAGFLVTYFLMKRTGISPEHPLVQMLQGSRWHVLGLYLLVSVFAPLMEETMFRGALFHHMRRRWGWAVSAPVVAIIFAAIHPQGWVAVPVLGSIALVLAALREWRGSLIAPMVAHACNNFIVLTLALAVLR